MFCKTAFIYRLRNKSKRFQTYFFLIYGYLYLQQPGPFIHYLAKINKELPDTYAALGVDENAQFPDQLFNEAIRVIKDDISKGKLNLNKYL